MSAIATYSLQQESAPPEVLHGVKGVHAVHLLAVVVLVRPAALLAWVVPQSPPEQPAADQAEMKRCLAKLV